MNSSHILLNVPDDWPNDQRGDFFESFVAELLEPLRFKVTQRVRVTGMEIDLLAKGLDQPRTVLVECKAQRDPLPADVISKLLGNVRLRHADEGWLFSTCDLSKDGRGQWEEIQSDDSLARTFTWYPPDKLLQILESQRAVVAPADLDAQLRGADVGDFTLVITPSQRAWVVELLDDGIPSRFSAFDATSGAPLPERRARQVAAANGRFEALAYFAASELATRGTTAIVRAPVARVVSGDAWDDLRPARPADFVGRSQLLADVADFVDAVRNGRSHTRALAIQAPSGWGKSSLVLKLVASPISECSITAVDSRSATNSAFVCEALRLALEDAVAMGILPGEADTRIEGLRYPLDSPGVGAALSELQRRRAVVVLLFDQFEELFAKETLFETFNAIRELCLDLDAKQVPILLGFAWKTDVALPQQHPAYHLWHQLSDRRRSFSLAELSRGDALKIIGRAERAGGQVLSSAVRTRLIEQCQGLPWLLKKLLVHVLKRIAASESQYLLLERELDVELLFREDLSQLSEEQVRCLKFVANRAPVAVAEVEETFPRDVTNSLLGARLLVRSGMNYVIYWDIFRDYLVQGTVPSIPWARTFQRNPAVPLRAVRLLATRGPLSTTDLAAALQIREGPCFNLLGDLLALQLVDRGDGGWLCAPHIDGRDPMRIAACAQTQLRRHVVSKALEKGREIAEEEWESFFTRALPRSSGFTRKTIRFYAGNFKKWLLFAGLLERDGRALRKPSGSGRQMGVVGPSTSRPGVFLGTGTPDGLLSLLRELRKGGALRGALEKRGLRNAVADAVALGLVTSSTSSTVRLTSSFRTDADLVRAAKDAVRTQGSIRVIAEALLSTSASQELGRQLAAAIGATWGPASQRRYGGGLRRYASWADKGPTR